MAQWVKVLAAKSNDLSSIPRSHVEERTDSSKWHRHTRLYAFPHTQHKNQVHIVRLSAGVQREVSYLALALNHLTNIY